MLLLIISRIFCSFLCLLYCSSDKGHPISKRCVLASPSSLFPVVCYSCCRSCNVVFGLQVRDADARRAASLKVEETASKEAHRCRLELGKLREREVILEAAMVRVDEDIRRLKVAHEHEIARRLEISKSRYFAFRSSHFTLCGSIVVCS